jgi:mRNA interferase RelE/StbE
MSQSTFRYIDRTDSFLKDYGNLPKDIQERVEKAISLLVDNLRHPSLRARKIQSAKGIWEASVTMSYRMTFKILKEGILQLRRVGTHDILKIPRSSRPAPLIKPEGPTAAR